MIGGGRRLGLVFWLARPRTTVRWRLTLLYGALFLASGVVLLAITYTLVDHATLTNTPFSEGPPRPVHLNRAVLAGRVPIGYKRLIALGKLPRPVWKLLGSRAGRTAVLFVGSDQRIADLHQLVIESVIALAIMAIISTGLGWLIAGRVLRPLRTMTAATRQISEANLDQRLALQGPRDELRQLGDTIDGLLGRLEGAFDAQRRFVANASHELRTPLTVARALLEMVISDPGATVQTFRSTCRQVLEEGEQQEQLIDALLALAHGQRELEDREPIDLALITGDVLRAHERDAAARGVHVDGSLEAGVLWGDRRLIERLISNLVENAIGHNVAGGRVWVRVRTRAGQAWLAVANTGGLVPADQVDRLLQPFQRLGGDRVGHRDGLGLGLSIVAAIAAAHHAALDVRPGADGGLEIQVRFPRAPRRDQPATPNANSPRAQPATAQLQRSPSDPVEATRAS